MLALEQLHVTLQGLEKEGTVLFLSEKVNLDALYFQCQPQGNETPSIIRRLDIHMVILSFI